MIENGAGKYILMAATPYLVHTTPTTPIMDNNGNGTTSEAIDPPHDSIMLYNIPIREHPFTLILYS